MQQEKVLRCAVPLLGLALLAIFTVLYAVDLNAYYRALGTIGGFKPFKYPFLDWEGVSASIKCWREGVNVYINNPCDVLNRPHDYSPLWLRAVFIPTGRAWTMPIGVVMILAFLLSLFWLVRPANWRELIVFALTCTSPLVLYAVERGNVDVIIFIMLVGAGVLSTGALAKRSLSYALILLAGLLKFYPLVVLATALRERPRTFWVIAAAVGLTTIGFVYRYEEELAAAWRNVPRVGGWGSVSLPFDGPRYALLLFPELKQFAWFTALPYGTMGVLLIVTTIQVIHLARNGNLICAFAKMPERDAMFFVIGAALITGCFFAGRNIPYRGVQLIFAVTGLVAMRRATDNPATRAMISRTVMIVVLVMWERFVFKALPHDVPGSKLGAFASALVWLIHEVLWWRLVAVLVAMLVIFTAKSEVFTALRQSRELSRQGFRP
jgi:hypothetical protein